MWSCREFNLDRQTIEKPQKYFCLGMLLSLNFADALTNVWVDNELLSLCAPSCINLVEEMDLFIELKALGLTLNAPNWVKTETQEFANRIKLIKNGHSLWICSFLVSRPARICFLALPLCRHIRAHTLIWNGKLQLQPRSVPSSHINGICWLACWFLVEEQSRSHRVGAISVAHKKSNKYNWNVPKKYV